MSSQLSDSLPGAGAAIAARWQVVHEAAVVVARLAGCGGEAPSAGFPAALRETGGWRRTLAEQALEDVGVILETGITALLSAQAPNRAAARALWDEFVAARIALMALAAAGAGELRPVG